MKRLIQVLLLSCFMFLIECKKKVKDFTIDRNQIETPQGMVWVPKKTFLKGAKDLDQYAMRREKPAHRVTVDGFFIDATEVTNKQFKAFVKATKYITVAERKIDWDEMKRYLPKDVEKPHDSYCNQGVCCLTKM